MTAKILLHKLQLLAALSLFALSTYSCSEPASPFGQTDITLTAQVTPIKALPNFSSQQKVTLYVTN
ncbi:MAG: hypothetical protein FMNOHCHN_00032 [Ignavibacteriaceae bacterium]|nr:hypothetical protein [Ignavibacteriaceae bacterium]